MQVHDNTYAMICDTEQEYRWESTLSADIKEDNLVK